MALTRAKKIRLGVGVLLVATVLGVFALDYALNLRYAVCALVGVLGLAGFAEFAKISGLANSERQGAPALGAVGLLATGYFLGLAWWQGHSNAGGSSPELGAHWMAIGLAAVGLGSLLAVMNRDDFADRVPAVLATLLGVVLFGVLFSYVLRIYQSGDRETAIIRGFVFFLGVKGTDIAAYLVGSAIGKRKFLKVSPGKTIEGSTAALLFGAAWHAGAGALYPELFFEWSLGALFGIILALTSALGDLFESLLKRHYQVKDSGSLLPEFGGVLDLIDSLVFSAVLFWCLLP